MGYSEESKSYGLFDPVKQQIIIRHNVIFDEKNYGLGLLKSPSSPSYIDPFGIVKDIKFTVPPICISTSSTISTPESTSSRSTPTKTARSPNNSSNGNGTSPNHCLPQWAIKMIEVVSTDVGDIPIGRQIHNHN